MPFSDTETFEVSPVSACAAGRGIVELVLGSAVVGAAVDVESFVVVVNVPVVV